MAKIILEIIIFLFISIERHYNNWNINHRILCALKALTLVYKKFRQN